jgi:hypothetical protein
MRISKPLWRDTTALLGKQALLLSTSLPELPSWFPFAPYRLLVGVGITTEVDNGGVGEISTVVAKAPECGSSDDSMSIAGETSGDATGNSVSHPPVSDSSSALDAGGVHEALGASGVVDAMGDKDIVGARVPGMFLTGAGTADSPRAADCARVQDGDGATGLDGDTAAALDGDGVAVRDGDGAAALDGDGTADLDGDGVAVQDGDGTADIDGDSVAVQDGVGAAALDGDGTADLDGDGVAVHDGVGAAAIDGEGETVLNGVGEAVHDGVGEAVHDGEGDSVLDSNGVIVSETNRVTVPDIDGVTVPEDDAVARQEGDGKTGGCEGALTIRDENETPFRVGACDDRAILWMVFWTSTSTRYTQVEPAETTIMWRIFPAITRLVLKMSLPTTFLTASTTSVSSSSVKKAISSLVNHLEVPQERAGFPDEIQYLRPANFSVIELNSVLLSMVVFALVCSISNVLPLTTAELSRVSPASASDVSHKTPFTIIFLLGMNSWPIPVSTGTSMWLIVCGQTAAFSCCFAWSIGNETVIRCNWVSIN